MKLFLCQGCCKCGQSERRELLVQLAALRFELDTFRAISCDLRADAKKTSDLLRMVSTEAAPLVVA